MASNINYGDNNSNYGDTIGSFNKTYNKIVQVYKPNRDAQIMRWLSRLEPNNRHQSIHTKRFNGIGDWLLGTTKWREWRGYDGGADKGVLFCSGNPGVGKTYLSSFVIDTLCDQARGRGVAVAGFYYDFLAQQEQTITDVMGCILKQLVGTDIPKYIREEFQKGKASRGPRLANLMVMLRITIASLRQVFICIDGLDECLQKNLPELLDLLRDIARRSPTTRIFLTGRPHVKGDIQIYFPSAAVVSISPNTNDIKSCLEMKFGRDAYPEAMNDNLRAAIVKIILEKVSDIFLLVSLNIDAILGEMTIRRRKKKLEEVKRGDGLSDVYTTTLARLKAQEGDKPIFGKKVLTWVMYSERQLRGEELRHALGVEARSEDLDPDDIPALRILLASCLGLVTVEESSSAVRLVHATLQEHLSRIPALLQNPHSTIAEVCLTYLNFGCVRDLSPTLESAPSATPLLEYASYYWGEHTRKGMTETVKLLALKLLDRFDEHISAQLLLLLYNQTKSSGPYFSSAGGPKGFTGLHAVAFLGIVEIVPAVLEMREWDVNAADYTGNTALTWAIRRGQDEVVKVLLEREDIDPNVADTQDGRTPLTLAAENGDERLVKMLLERKDVRAATPDNKNQTPLSLARSKGHDGIVRILLERDNLNPDTRDYRSQEPFPLSARSVDEFQVEMGFRDDDPNIEVANLSGQPVAGGPAAEKQVVENLVARELLGISVPNGQEVGEGLKYIIKIDRKGLQRMYGGTEAELDKCLEVPTKRGEEMARKLITMGCNIEVAKDLTALTLYDVAILIDDSDSMIYEENGARKETLIQFVDHITEIYSMANESGILSMRFMNSYRSKENWTGKSKDYLDHHSYGGLARIGTALKERILDRFATGNPNQSKPLLVITVTNGIVHGEKKGYLKKVIQDCVNEREGAGKGFDAVSFQFSLVGNDAGAAKLLEDLDCDPDIGEYIDMLPVKFSPEGEFDKWFVLPKILLGAIIPYWDKQDDYGQAELKDYLAGGGFEDWNAESYWEE